MRNPKVYIILVLLLVVVFVFYLLKNKGSEKIENKEVEIKNKEALKGSTVYILNPSESKIMWQAKKTFIVNSTDEGYISIKEGSFQIENDEITKGSVSIDMNSISTSKTAKGGGENMLSGHLKSADFFDVKKFGTSNFTIKSVNKVDDTNYILSGDLTIKDITKSIEAPVSIYESEGKVHIDGELIVDRSLFGVKYGSANFFKDLGDKTIDDNFTLKLKLVANKN